jgi:hypothetical protein
MDLEKKRYCVEALKTTELLLKELLQESKERTQACLKLHEAALWVESISIEGAERSLTAELFSKHRRKNKKNNKHRPQSPISSNNSAHSAASA